MIGEASSFVQAVEIWVPDGDVLRHHSGAYGPHLDLARQSAQSTFRRGQGLPGSAWSKGVPVVWPALKHQFLRFQPVRDVALHAGVAVPLYRDQTLVAVLVLLLGDPARSGGAVEMWEPKAGLLGHVGAYYGCLEPAFSRVSQRLTFPKGRGLPGMTWMRGSPYLLEDLRHKDYFVRAILAQEYHVDSGIGIPFYRGREVAHVMTLLSRNATPFARAFEVWSPDGEGKLRLQQAVYGAGLEAFAAISRKHTFVPGEGLPGRAYESALPVVFGSIRVGPFVRHQAAEEAGLNVGVALPIHDGESVRSVFVMLS